MEPVLARHDDDTLSWLVAVSQMRVFARFCISYEAVRVRVTRRINCIVISVNSLDIVLEGLDYYCGSELGTIGDLGKAQEIWSTSCLVT